VRDKLRVGVVGAGVVLDRYHMPAINGVPEVARTIIVDADGARARRAAERYGFPEWSTDLADLASHADLAIVLVPNGFHARVSCQLLSQGVHVLCEKPMARNADECLTMIESANRGRAQLAVGHNRRFRQHVMLARQLLQRGLIGDVVSIQGEEGSPADWPRSSSYFDPQQSGGGALMDVGIHSIDLVRWLVGEFGEVEYKGNANGTGVESDAELRFRLATGATGTLVSSRTRVLAQKLTLIGSEGFLEIGLWGTTLGIRCAKGKTFRHFHRLDAAVSRRPPQDASFVEQLRHFVSAIRGDEALLVDGYEGMAAVEVVCRAYQGGTGRSLAHASVPEVQR